MCFLYHSISDSEKSGDRGLDLSISGRKAFVEGGYGTPEMIYAEIEPLRSRQKRHVLMQGKNILDFRKHRRPDFYGLLTERK